MIIFTREPISHYIVTTFIASILLCNGSTAYLKATDAPLAQLESAHRLSAGVAVASAKLELQDTPSGRKPPGVVVVSKYTMFRT